MEHTAAIIVHSATEDEAESTARTTGDELCEYGPFSWVERVEDAHELDGMWTSIEETTEENMLSLIDRASDGDVLSQYLQKTLNLYEDSISEICNIAEGTEESIGREAFAKENVMELFQRVGQERGRDVYVFDILLRVHAEES